MPLTTNGHLPRNASAGATYAQTLGLGALAGMRSWAASALLSDHLTHQPRSYDTWMDSPLAAAITKAIVLAEMVGDKTSGMPNRTAPLALAGRVLFGASAGWTLCKVKGHNHWTGAALGAAAAAGATYGSYHVRRWLIHEVGVPNKLAGVAEDLLVAGSGAALFRSAPA